MHCPLWRCCVVSVGLGVLWLLFTLEMPREVEDDQDRMAVKDQMLPLPVPQEDSHRRRKDLGPPEDWKNLTSKYLERLQQRKKREGSFQEIFFKGELCEDELGKTRRNHSECKSSWCACWSLKPRAAEPWLQEASAAARLSTLAQGSSGFRAHQAPADGVQAQSPGGAALRTARVCSPLQGGGRERAGARPLTPPLASPAWLTVGVSSRPRPGPDPSSLLYTLLSVFRATSKVEQKRLTVLVHLAGADPAWLGETVLHISSLFSPQILAGQLLLIHAPPDAYPPAGAGASGASGRELYSEQNVDHAFLLSSASKLSEYFLLLEDNAFCAPSFISHLQWKVEALRSQPWAFLEFANLGVLGKLFRSSDLPTLAHFLLLFYREKPLDRLLAHFRVLLAQKDPILCTPFLFYHRAPYDPRNDRQKALGAHRKSSYAPDNPPGAAFTDMKVFEVHSPWEAYTLDESFFWTLNVSAGNHLTVILNQPADLRRVQVLTGTIVEGKYALERGQVELGYGPEGMPQRCSSFVLLGRLLEGQLDQEVVPRSVGHQVSCVRLLANANQAGGLIVRHIYLWEEHARDVGRSG
uniref:Uncharacterized protein n=1 Tax=Ovis aries TaxID=9940 RepID=A0AC11EDI3_SHEEP